MAASGGYHSAMPSIFARSHLGLTLRNGMKKATIGAFTGVLAVAAVGCSGDSDDGGYKRASATQPPAQGEAPGVGLFDPTGYDYVAVPYNLNVQTAGDDLGVIAIAQRGVIRETVGDLQVSSEDLDLGVDVEIDDADGARNSTPADQVAPPIVLVWSYLLDPGSAAVPGYADAQLSGFTTTYGEPEDADVGGHPMKRFTDAESGREILYYADDAVRMVFSSDQGAEALDTVTTAVMQAYDENGGPTDAPAATPQATQVQSTPTAGGNNPITPPRN